MKPFYYTATTNFGDHMNGWLWPQLIPELIDDNIDTRLVGIGSLLSRNLDLVPGKKVIFGTGSGYSSPPTPEQAANWKVYCVRGPLTAQLLGLDPALAITDPAWLIHKLPKYAEPKPESTRSGTVFIPHWTSDRFGVWEKVCAQAGLTYVSPFAPCEEVFDAIAGAKLVLAESLHAAILADYFRTPWIPVVSPARVLTFKWLDWCGSLGVEYEPYALPASDYLDCLLQKLKPRDVARDFDGTPTRIPVAKEKWDIVQTPPPPPRPTAAYRLKQRLKTPVRNARDKGLNAMAQVRDGMLFKRWNQTHQDKLTAWATAVSALPAQLSTDAIRQQRLEELEAALEQMRRDFSS